MSTPKDDETTLPCVDVDFDGRVVRLYAGALIGRVQGASLLIDDPRVSEAHALLSLRRGHFVLLALRRLLMVDGEPLREIPIIQGMEVAFARGVAITIRAVRLPASSLSVGAEGITSRRLGPVSSLYGGAKPRVIGRFDPAAPCHIWSAAGVWRISRGGEESDLSAGDDVEVEGTVFLFREDSLQSEMHSTQQPGRAFGSLHLVTYFEGVAIHREGHPTLTLGGVGARIVSELAAFGGPAPWLTVAGEVWEDAAQRTDVDLRQRWDTAIRRLRTKLKDAGVRSGLIRADGVGNYQLVLEPTDTHDDRS